MLNLKENRFYKFTTKKYVRICYYQDNILYELFYFHINTTNYNLPNRAVLTKWTEENLLVITKSISIVEINIADVLKMVNYETLIKDLQGYHLKYIPPSVSDIIQDLITKLEQNDLFQK